MKALQRKTKSVWESLADAIIDDTVKQIKRWISDDCELNLSDSDLDSIWWYWLRKNYPEDHWSKHYLDYRWNGEYEESFIKDKYIREFVKWLETVDVEEVNKIISEEE